MRRCLLVGCCLGTAARVLPACELPAPMSPPMQPAPATPVAGLPPGPAVDAGLLADAGTQVDEAAGELVDPAKWFLAHGAKKESLDEYDSASGCVSIVVGAAREPALLCTDVKDVSRGQDDTLVYRVVTHQIVRVVRAGKVVTVLDALTRMESLDGPPPRPGQRRHGIVDLELGIAPDGLSATVDTVDPAADCHARDAAVVIKGDDEVAVRDRAWAAFDREWETRLCNGRGRYTWKGRRFVRAR